MQLARETVESNLREFVLDALDVARRSGVVPANKTIYSRVDVEGGTNTECEIVPDAPSEIERRGQLRDQVIQLPSLDTAADSLLEFKGTEIVSKRWVNADLATREASIAAGSHPCANVE